jgi:hypothetical protein
LIQNGNEIQTQGRNILFEDGFETYEDFVIEFPPWILVDVDGDPTVGHNQITWPNQWQPQAAIIFNPSQTSPPMEGADPHTGEKYMACFNADNVGYINDDWMIIPQLEPANFDELTLWARAYSDQYQLDTFEIGVSTTDPEPEEFTLISPTIEATLTWTEYSFNLDDYDWETIYVGIHCNSIDAWFLMIDDVSVTGSLYPPLEVDAGGPYEVFEGESIQFQGSVTGGLEPYTFNWDFGDGHTSDEQNPEHTYDDIGTYDVTFTVTDSAAQVAEDDTTATVNEIPCWYDVTIPTGFSLGLKATVTETRGEAHTGDPWKFTITGGIVIPISKLTGTADFAAGETKDIKAPLLLGIGNVEISFVITTKCDSTVVNAFILGPFVIVR